MVSFIKFTLILMSLVFLPSNAFSIQRFIVENGDTIKINISEKDVTKISFDKDVRIDKYWTDKSENIEFTPEKDKGELFLTVIKKTDDSKSFLMRDSNGSTYTVILTIKDIPSQIVILESKAVAAAKKKSKTLSANKASDHLTKISALMKEMVNDKLGIDNQLNSSRNKIEEDEEEPFKWKGLTITLLETYSADDIQGEIYVIANPTKSSRVLNSKVFLKLGPGVYAVALQSTKLKSRGKTKLYLIRKNGENNE